jgi:alcohol dehydrogenase class IV
LNCHGLAGSVEPIEFVNIVTLLQALRIVFGDGCAPQCAGLFAQRGVGRVLLVTSTPVRSTLVALLEALKRTGIVVVESPPVDAHWSQECGVAQKLSEVGVPRDAIPRMARSAMTVTRLLNNNLRPVTELDAVRIYESAYYY